MSSGSVPAAVQADTKLVRRLVDIYTVLKPDTHLRDPLARV